MEEHIAVPVFLVEFDCVDVAVLFLAFCEIRTRVALKGLYCSYGVVE